MIERGILSPVLPEIVSAERLALLCGREAEAGIAPHKLRRLAALLPQDEAVAGDIAARLRLSRSARARLVCAAVGELKPPELLAYEAGRECAIDRILLSEQADPAHAAGLREWERPQLDLTGGDLIAMGLAPGPVVARTLQQIEREWVAAGFPKDRGTMREMAARAVGQALRESQ
jgi:poly(A) polymerase